VTNITYFCLDKKDFYAYMEEYEHVRRHCAMSTKTILLVDDTKLFLELEKNFLKLSPVRVLTASSGEEALEVIRKERPDLVFMDLHMPGMGGAACCGKIKADPSLSDIPVVMVTSSGKDEDLELCGQAGCDGYVTKPIDRRVFLEKARGHLHSIDRREPRISYRAQVTFTVDGIPLCGTSQDLSCGGIYLASERELQEKKELLLEIPLPEPKGSPVRAKGVVAWGNSSGKKKKSSLPAGFGVEFVEMQESDSASIRSFIETHRKVG
jgi:CheY-like chemotaxis protein